MKFKLEKVTNQNIWKPVLEGNRCKEEFLFQIYALDFHTKHSPTKAWFEYLDEHYPSADVMREFYLCDVNKWFENIAGWVLRFSDKKEAQRYVKELNDKLEELGLQ